ncbi:MAG: hypothetical protein WC483_00115 [Candidatus Paceibacterota bacterium]
MTAEPSAASSILIGSVWASEQSPLIAFDPLSGQTRPIMLPITRCEEFGVHAICTDGERIFFFDEESDITEPDSRTILLRIYRPSEEKIVLAPTLKLPVIRSDLASIGKEPVTIYGYATVLMGSRTMYMPVPLIERGPVERNSGRHAWFRDGKVHCLSLDATRTTFVILSFDPATMKWEEPIAIHGFSNDEAVVIKAIEKNYVVAECDEVTSLFSLNRESAHAAHVELITKLVSDHRFEVHLSEEGLWIMASEGGGDDIRTDIELIRISLPLRTPDDSPLRASIPAAGRILPSISSVGHYLVIFHASSVGGDSPSPYYLFDKRTMTGHMCGVGGRMTAQDIVSLICCLHYP